MFVDGGIENDSRSLHGIGGWGSIDVKSAHNISRYDLIVIFQYHMVYMIVDLKS